MSTGIQFHDNLGVDGLGTQAFQFSGSNVPGFQGCTYIWRARFIQHSGYYTTFFYETDINHDYVGDRSYFGCHPYPLDGYLAGSGSTGSTHNFEISTDGNDVCGKDLPGGANDHIDEGGFQTSAQTDGSRWYVQACVVSASNGIPTIDFYWDLANSLQRRIHYTLQGTYTTPAGGVSGLNWGCSPWNGYTLSETMDGVLRGLQIYSTPLSLNIVSAEALNDTSNTPTTTSGQNAIWYINQNPTPSDISDKSGKGNNPFWVGTSHGALFSAADSTVVSLGTLTASYSVPSPQINKGWTTSVGTLSASMSVPSIAFSQQVGISSVTKKVKF